MAKKKSAPAPQINLPSGNNSNNNRPSGGNNNQSGGNTNSNRSVAVSMAASGSSPKQIARQTGVSREAAQNIVQRVNNNQQMTIRNTVDQRAQSGGSIGQQWFENSGLNAGQRQAAMDYATSQGYNLGGAWADEKNPIFNSAGDQVKRVGTERNAEQLAYRDQLKSKYGDNFQEKFVAGLMSPGQKGYDASTGGGNWVYSQGPIDEEALRAWYRGDPNNGTDLALQGKNRGDFTLDGLYSQYSAPGTAQAAQENAASQKKARNYQAAMADGRISRKEINTMVDQRAESKGKSFNRNNAYLRIANRWAGQGGGLGQGVLKDFNQAYEKKNPFASMLYGKTGNLNQILAAGRTKKQQSMYDLYTSGRGYLENKNYAKGDVFTRLKDGTLRAGKPVGNGYTKPATTTETTPKTQTDVYKDADTGPTGTAMGAALEGASKAAETLSPGGLYGGGAGGPGASRLRRARSRQQQLGIRGAGTSINNRTSPFFNALNR